MCVSVLPPGLLIIVWRNSCATNQSPFNGGRVIKVCSSHKIQCTWSNTIHSIHKLSLLGTHTHTNIHRAACTHALTKAHTKCTITRKAKVSVSIRVIIGPVYCVCVWVGGWLGGGGGISLSNHSRIRIRLGMSEQIVSMSVHKKIEIYQCLYSL